MRRYSNSQIRSIIDRNEQVLWRGRPNKLCYVFESIFNPLLPFALIWFIFDFFFISVFLSIPGSFDETAFFIIPFFLIHLMPVWIYLYGVLTTWLRYKNTSFLVTDKGVYLSSGIFFYKETFLDYLEIEKVEIKRSFFDKHLGVGDVFFPTNEPAVIINGRVKEYQGERISDIPDFVAVFDLINEYKAKAEYNSSINYENSYDSGSEDYLKSYDEENWDGNY